MAVRTVHRSCPAEETTALLESVNEIALALNAVIARLAAVTAIANEVRGDHNSLLAKLDLDASVADEDYETLAVSSTAADPTPIDAVDLIGTDF